MRWAIVLAGGVGSRFWPLSTAQRPKQLLPLAGPRPLIAETVDRLLPLIPAERILVVTSRAVADAFSAALPALPAENILAEPDSRSTAPAVAWATALAASRDPAATLVSVHADWTVGDSEAFRTAAAAALELAERHDVLVTVGARPTRIETGYGYVVPGEPLGGTAHRIARFVEKPDATQAERLLAEGALWNTGLFAWTASRFRRELEAHAAELAPGLAALDRGDAPAMYAVVPAVSVDVALFERSRRSAVIAGEFGWDDVGSWAALRRVRSLDPSGNVLVGGAHARASRDCVVWAEDGAVVVDGISGAVVVQARGITLVTSAERAPDLKKLLDSLPPDLAGERGA